jgi:cytosine/adenosine deaminase-related metal-dependent hydrolase
MTSLSSKYFKADWVVPVTQQPIRNGVVGIEKGIIFFVGKEKDVPKNEMIIELKGIILPGLINTHTHLDEAVLHGAIPPGNHYMEWKEILNAKKKRFQTEQIESAARFMIHKFYFEGIAAFGDFLSTPELLFTRYFKKNMGQIFLSVEYSIREQLEQKMKAIRNLANQFKEPYMNISVGFSPGIYFDKTVLQRAKNWQTESIARNVIAFHCCEIEEEIEFFLTGKGVLKNYYFNKNFLNSGFEAPSKRPVLFLNDMGLLNDNTILINPIHVTQNEINLIGIRGANVCWTPTANYWMKYGRVPVMELMKKNANICLGTDTPAKNPYMSLWYDIVEANLQFPELLPESVIRMATINGARALKIDQWVGSIIPGKLDRVGILVTDERLHSSQEMYEYLVLNGFKHEWYWLHEIEEMVKDNNG